jgi:hypothetical protein
VVSRFREINATWSAGCGSIIRAKFIPSDSDPTPAAYPPGLLSLSSEPDERDHPGHEDRREEQAEGQGGGWAHDTRLSGDAQEPSR